MKNNLKRFLTSALAITMAVSMAACGATKTEDKTDSSGTTTAAESTAAQKELYKIDVFTMLGNAAGPQTGWFAKIVKDKFNIEMNMIASNVEGGDTKFATMMASGNLGDLIIFGNDGDKYRDAIKGGFLADWAKDGLLDNYGKYIKDNYAKAIEKNKVNFGNGTSIYGLGHEATTNGPGPSEGKEMVYQSDLRFDLYQKAGSPELRTIDDLLPVLKKMQELEPKSETGKPTYGFSLWSEWDGNMMMNAKIFSSLYGYEEGDGLNGGGFILVSPDEDKYQEILDANSYYQKGLKLLFKANQMGLVDPDSISQKYEDVMNKYKDGQVLFCTFPWLDNMYNTQERMAEGKGFAFVPVKDEKIYSFGFNQYGGDRVISIGSKAKKPERVMELIDWLYTPEGCMTNYNGPQGLTWEIKDGKPVLTDFGKKALPNNPVDVPAEFGGGSFKDGQNQMNYAPVHRNTINPETNEAYEKELWTSVLQDTPDKLTQNWRDAFGALTPKDYVVKNKLLGTREQIFTGKAPETLDKTLQQKMNQVATVIKQYSWKMVFAKNEAQYNSLYDEMVKKAKGLGYDEVTKWYVDEANKVFEIRKTMTK